MWNLVAAGKQIMRAADCKKLAEKPEGIFRQAQESRKQMLPVFILKRFDDGFCGHNAVDGGGHDTAGIARTLAAWVKAPDFGLAGFVS